MTADLAGRHEGPDQAPARPFFTRRLDAVLCALRQVAPPEKIAQRSALLAEPEARQRHEINEAVAGETLDDNRRRDTERLTQQVRDDFMAGRERLLTGPAPESLTATGKETT